MDETLTQFELGERVTESPGAAQVPRVATVCPECQHHFSPDARFCPFDGGALRPAPEWRLSADPLLGTVVDHRYEILSVIGEGGMGVVYEARHATLGKGFALKALRKDLACDAELAARFIQEARTAASVSHPGLVEITDFGRLVTGQPFFVMELLHGQSLAQLIRRGGPIPAARAVDIVRQIADALGAAHELSIIHRDLKPDNIHVSPGASGVDRITIVDFGLARVIGASRLTRAGLVFGTPHYMSPEQAQGEASDHRSDIYALGVVMYEMFTGRVPFEADSYMGVLTKHIYMVPTPPSQLAATTQLGALEDIILRCLEKKPEHRYASLRELRHDLDLAIDAAGTRPYTSRPRRVTPRSVLADELELPSRDELSYGRGRPARIVWRNWPVFAVASFFIAGLGGALWLRGRTVQESPTPWRASSARVLPSSHLEAPRLSGASSPALEILEAAVDPTPTSAPPKGAPARRKSTSQSGPRVPVARPGPEAKKTPLKLGASEIVDPWAK